MFLLSLFSQFCGLFSNYLLYNFLLTQFSTASVGKLYFLFSVAPLVILSYFAISGTKIQKALFALAILLSRPIMIGFERGNSIMSALAFVMLFLLCYKSKDPLIHEIALIGLACAFAHSRFWCPASKRERH